MTDLELDDLLHRELFAGLTHEEFTAKWEDEVGDPVQEMCTKSFELKIPKRGKCTIHVLRGGLVALEDGKKKWSAYETLERVSEREYLAAWADFARGYWTSAVPTEEGTYPTRDLEGRRATDRVLRKHQGRLIDVTRGFVSCGKATEWRGQWWSAKFPKLKDSP